MDNIKFLEVINNIKISGFKNFGYLKDNNVCYLMGNLDNKILKLSIRPCENTLSHERFLIHFDINFPIVTRIINEVLGFELREEYPFWWENADTIFIGEKLFSKLNQESNCVTLKHTMTPQDISDFYNKIQFAYDTFLHPFIDYYSDLNIINVEIIEKYTSDEWSNFIPGETIFKVLVIMKLCNNNRYNDFLTEYKSNIENAISNGNIRYLNYYNQLVKLTEYLKTDNYKKSLKY